MKAGHFEMVTMLLAAVILMDIFQVKAEMLDMADNAFDDEYLKCTDRMETKYVPQLLKEEKASHQLLETVWENAEAKWEAQKTQLFLPMNFKDNHGIALMAYISQALEQTPFYQLFNEAVEMAGQSRKDYIYDFQFKAFHFYLTRALQLLRRPCEDSYRNVVYRTSHDTSFTFGGLNQARFGHFTLAYSAEPQAANDQHILLTIYTCFGVSIEKFFDKESKRIVLIPLNEVFHVSREGSGSNLILQSTNRTCSHYECAFLGGLKTDHCVENVENFQPVYDDNPGEGNQELEDPGMKSQQPTVLYVTKNHEPTQLPGMKSPEPFSLPGTLWLSERCRQADCGERIMVDSPGFRIKVVQPDEKPEEGSQGSIDRPTPGPGPGPGPGPVPVPKTHPSASSGKMLLPPFRTVIILISASAVTLFVAL